MKTSILMSAFLLLCAVSCRKERTEFDEKLVIDPKELLITKEFDLNCQTERVYSRGNFGVYNTISRNGNNIVINFFGASFSSDFPVPGPATGLAQIGILNNGRYILIINNGKKQSVGMLTVSDESYTLSFDKLNDISFKHTKLYRIPANTLWGIVKYRGASLKSVADSFTDSLEYLGAQPFTGSDGYYGYFDLSSGNVTRYQGDRFNYPFVKGFVYKYAGDKNMVDTLVHSFGNRNIDSAYFNANNSEGNIYEFPMMPVYKP